MSHEHLGLVEALPDATKDALAQVASEVRLPAGARIFEEGDPGDALYVIRSGLVDVIAGDTRLLTLSPGETLGEQALITGHPRSASAVAQTGVTLWRIEHADFLALLSTEPELATAVARIVSERLRAASRDRAGLPRGQTLVVWAAGAEQAGRAARSLARACAPMLRGDVVAFAFGDGWSTAALPDGCTVIEDITAAAVREVREHALVMLLCHPTVPSELLDGADRIVVVGDDVRMRERAGPVHQLRTDATTEQVQRLARAICGRTVGIALGSGGIRGFAHAGVLAVLQEADVPIDLVAGASAGSIAGALFLGGMPPRDFANIPLAMREAVKTGMPTFSMSPQALLKGRRILSYLRTHLGRDTLIEDLPVRFIAATTDLDSRGPYHVDHGNLADAVAASAAVPGVFPAVRIDGRRLVDGGVSDPVPVGALRTRGADIVIAVNVMLIGKGPMGMYKPRFPIPMPGLLESLMIGFDTIVSQIAVHACRLADVVVEPSQTDARWYDVVPAQMYMKAGERAMQDALPKVLELLGR